MVGYRRQDRRRRPYRKRQIRTAFVAGPAKIRRDRETRGTEQRRQQSDASGRAIDSSRTAWPPPRHGFGIRHGKTFTMKRVLFAVLFSTALLSGGLQAKAQHHYVKAHPEATVVERPAAPSGNHVWIGSEWKWSGGKYVESSGHWALPPHGHRTWVQGRWEKTSRGEYWVAGHWS